jgi:hypothetical protein
VQPKPVAFIWGEAEVVDARTGEIARKRAMVPLPRFDNLAKRQFVDGEEYVLAPIEERSMASHNQYFAALKGYFDNLPESISARWPTPQHFRRWLLIEAGWFDEKEFEMVSSEYAHALGAFVRTADEYARILIRGKKVIVQKAKSQSRAAMGKEAFQQSKRDVLDLAESMVGTPVRTMMREAGNHA